MIVLILLTGRLSEQTTLEAKRPKLDTSAGGFPGMMPGFPQVIMPGMPPMLHGMGPPPPAGSKLRFCNFNRVSKRKCGQFKIPRNAKRLICNNYGA